MLSCSLDPDQDLKSGSKLFTWYDVCCNIRGGGVYVLVVKFSGGDYVLVVKFSGGDYVLVVKFMGGILSTYTKMSRGDFVRGGFCLTLRSDSWLLMKHFAADSIFILTFFFNLA